MGKIDEEYDRLRPDSANGGPCMKKTKRNLLLETFELIRQSRAARASYHQLLTSELAKLYRTAIKKGFKEVWAEVVAEAAEAGLGIRNDRRNSANLNTKIVKMIP